MLTAAFCWPPSQGIDLFLHVYRLVELELAVFYVLFAFYTLLIFRKHTSTKGAFTSTVIYLEKTEQQRINKKNKARHKTKHAAVSRRALTRKLISVRKKKTVEETGNTARRTHF